jgi:hypothetical protein
MQKTVFIEIIILTQFMLLLATTFVVSHELGDGIVSGKYFWFYLSTGLISIISFGLVSFSRNKLQFSLLDGLILLWGILFLIFNSGVHHSEAVTKQILLILVIILYFYFRFIFQVSKRSIYFITLSFIITGLVEAVWGLRQLYGFAPSQHNLFGMTGSFFNPGPFACYIAIVLPMSVYYVLRYRICHKVKFHFRNLPIYILWTISVLTVFASLLVILASMSRASWLAAIGSCCWVLFCFYAKNRKIRNLIVCNKRKFILLVSILFILIVVSGFGAYQLKKDSADGRIFIWKNTIELIRQNPLGVGLGNFSGSYGHIQAAYFEAGNYTKDEERVAGIPDYAFNEYLQICVEQGVIVFLLFISIVVYSLIMGIKQKRIAATASFVALLLAAFASYPFSVLPFLIAFVFLLARINQNSNGIAIPESISATLIFCSMVIITLCLYNRYPTYEAYKKWTVIKWQHTVGNYKTVATEYQKIHPLLSDRIQFLFEYAQFLSKSKQYEESNKVLEKAVKISCDPMLYCTRL